jgi:hypothetical protein
MRVRHEQVVQEPEDARRVVVVVVVAVAVVVRVIVAVVVPVPVVVPVRVAVVVRAHTPDLLGRRHDADPIPAASACVPAGW